MSLIKAPAECIDRVYQEFGTSRSRVLEDIKTLKMWMQQQPHLPNIEDDLFFENMMLRSKCSVERTKHALDMHFTIKTAVPELFSGRDPLSHEIQTAFTYLEEIILPQTSAEGCRVTIFRYKKNKDLTHFKSESILKAGMMMVDRRLYYDLSVAEIIIYDQENVSMGHVSRLTLPTLKKFIVSGLEGYRARIQSVHFVNVQPVLDILLRMAKPMLKKKVSERIHVHTNMSSLHDYVDREMLPKDYNGLADSLEEMNAKCLKELKSHRDWFLEQDIIGRVDESKRPGKNFNSSELFGIEGSFKKLNVD